MKPETQKSLLVTVLLMAHVVLLLFIGKLHVETPPYEETYYETELADIELLEEFLRQTENETNPVETHQSYNEALPAGGNKSTQSQSYQREYEEFIEQLELQRQDNSLLAMNTTEPKRVYKKYEKKNNDSEEEEATESEEETSNFSHRNSTNYYHLINRTAVYFPNPVYTCPKGGKIVVNIAVNQAGVVTSVAVNQAASDTSDGCLIDQALHYASQARFTSHTSLTSQVGTITYIFPGQ